MTSSVDFPMTIIAHTYGTIYKVGADVRFVPVQVYSRHGISKLFSDYHLNYTRAINLSRCTNDYSGYQRYIIGRALSVCLLCEQH